VTGSSQLRAIIGRSLASRRQRGGGRRRRRPYSGSGAPLLALITLLLTLVSIQPAAAHPLGNFSVNQYSRLEIGTDQIHLTYVLDLAELPTVADATRLDGDADGTVDAAERERYLDAKLAEITSELHVTAGGTALPLKPGPRSLTFVPGQAGLETTRIDAEFSAALPVGNDAGQISYRNDYAIDRLGWREIVVTHDADIRLDDAETLAVDRSQALRTYPDDLLSSPLDERAAEIAFQIAPGEAASESAAITSASGPAAIGERLAAIVNGGDLTTTGMMVSPLGTARPSSAPTSSAAAARRAMPSSSA
jgi:nickel/cobalt exporter